MKTLRILILSGSLSAFACQAQLILTSGNVDPSQREAAIETKQAELAAQPQGQFGPLTQNVPSTPIAEAITPDIQALADGLQDDPVRIFNYVHDHIRHDLYFGSKKGAELTYLEKSGNDFDQCALLVALLHAAGYTNTAYNFGWMELPYDATDGTHNDLHHWLRLNLTNTNWSYTSNYLDSLIRVYQGYPADAAIWGNNTFAFQRVWVTLTNGSTVYYLDPSFKVSEPIPGINLAAAMGFSSNDLMSAAHGVDNANYVTNLDESALNSKLTAYTSNLLAYIQNNYPNASVDEILSGWRIVPSTNTTLPTALNFPTYTWGGQMPVLTWGYEPTNLMASINISFEGTNFACYIPQLEGKRLTLTYDYTDFAQLWLEDTDVADNYAYQGTVAISVDYPVGYWNTNNNTFVDTTAYDVSTTNNYDIYGNIFYPPNYNAYNIVYGFEPDWGWLKEREDSLNNFRQYYGSDGSFDVIAETMNVMGLQYLLQATYTQRILAAQANILPDNYLFLGRLGQEGGQGYYFDMFSLQSSDVSDSGMDAANQNRMAQYEGLLSYLYSGFEGGVIEQLQDSNYLAATTVKILEQANSNGEAIFLANSNNWQTGANVRNSLTNYSNLSVLDGFISSGDTLLLPQNGAIQIGSGWTGEGFIDHFAPGLASTYIQGTYSGGAVSDPNAIVNPAYVAWAGQAQPRRSPFAVHATGADPVDMANGTFQVEHTDLSLGQPEPRGITFGRYYNSLNRYFSVGGMAPGWVNNYDVNAQAVPAPQASLGATTPAQMAPMLAAGIAAYGIYNDAQPDPKNWTVTALITQWAMDQLNRSGVSVQMGKDIVQFVQQPNGAFTPPGNCTWALTKPGNYVLQERHGNTFNFDSLGRLTNVVDQYNEPLTVSYLNGTSSLPQTVSDWKGRTLTFSYTGTPPLLSSVADSTGRSVSYGYTLNTVDSNLDLTSVVDPDGNTNRFAYDGNHDITATFDALNRLVVSNIYGPYGFGQVYTQYTGGNTNQARQIFWSGWETVVQDPAGGQQRFFYDDKSRLVGFEDALSNLTQTFFDGQDHLVMTVSPLLETNQFVYDGNNNLIEFIDPLGFTNQFFYDGNNDLIRSEDGRGNPSTFGYNSEFSLTGSTNGAGDWVNFAYNTDGTLHTRTDSGGQTQYGYDTYGQLNSITYPNGLGGESFVNNPLGDPTSHTDANGNITSFYYDNRRDLTNTIAPTNVTFSVAFDPVGNVASTTDARHNTTTNSWSATRKPLTTTLPTVAAGTPVFTRVYDNRDWLAETLDPLENPTLYTNNLAGWLVSVTDPFPRTTAFGFDADGRNIAATNAALETTYRAWNGRNDLIQLTDGASHSSERVFDAAGNEITLTNRNNKVWQFQFDGANRLTNTITPLNRTMSQTWNHQGLLSTITDPTHRTTYLYYDGKGRLTNRTDQVGTILYGYDPNNNLISVSGNGLTNTWTYDAYNRVSSYKDAYGNLIQYKRDADGNVTNLVYPGGKNVYYTFDNDNHLTQVKDWAQRTTYLTYYKDGRLATITRPNRTFRTIVYDSAGEPTNVLEQMANGLPIALFRYAWNNADGMQWEFIAPLPHTNSPPTRQMTYNDDNELSTVDGFNVTEDTNGNLTYGPLTNDTSFVNYAFDARNRLLNAGGVTNVFDAANNRIGQTYGTNSVEYVVNPNAALPQVLMRIKNGVTNYYVYGPGLLYQVTETTNGEKTLTYHYDYRGSTIALSDDNGLVTDRMEYSAYATLTYRAGTSDTPFLFNGYYGVMSDPNGLLYFRARYYNPFICRFISPDPSGFAGGLNWYAYANGDPISLLDPFGLGVMEGWGGATATWFGRNIVAPLNSVSTTSTALNFSSYMAASLIGGFSDMLRLGQGTAYATYDAQNGWDVAIGVTEDIQRAAGLSAIAIGGLQGAVEDVGGTTVGADLRFSQTTASPWFSEGSLFGGQTVSDVAAQLRAGTLTPANAPIETVTIDGNTLIVNTRSALALKQAGIPPSAWNLIDQSSDAELVNSIATRLANNRLTSAGTPVLRITGSGGNASTLSGSGTIPRPY
jgi:RHS repeat-associated protein